MSCPASCAATHAGVSAPYSGWVNVRARCVGVSPLKSARLRRRRRRDGATPAAPAPPFLIEGLRGVAVLAGRVADARGERELGLREVQQHAARAPLPRRVAALPLALGPLAGEALDLLRRIREGFESVGRPEIVGVRILRRHARDANPRKRSLSNSNASEHREQATRPASR